MAALNSPFLLLLLATTTLFLHTTTAASARTSASPSLSGGYTPIPVDHHVEEVAKFAVDEHNRQAHDHLVYSKTLKAERQVVSGYNYRLVISTLRNGVANNYQAVVYVPLGSGAKPQLTSFNSLLQTANPATIATATAPASPPLLGAYKPIPVDHYVEELAKFAIDEHNKEAHDHLVYSKTLRAEKQLVNGNNYRLVISALRDKVANNYQAVVYVPFGSNAKPQLTSFKPLRQTVTATTTTTTATPPLVGGYTPIPVDHYVEELSKFAIDEHNRQAHDHLVYSKTLRAERQVVSGYNYRLVISALRNGVANNYQAVVYVPLGSGAKPQLSSFNRLLKTANPATIATATAPTPPPLIGGYKPVPIDHYVEELAKFAIDEHNKQAHDHLVYSKTLRAEKQLVNGNNYRLVISALRDKVANNYQAVVYVPFGAQAKPQLTSFKPLLQTATATVTASPPLIGGYTLIPIDHHVEELAKFAINEHNRQAHAHLVYSKTLKAERQLVNGYNYRLLISALRDGPVAYKYQALVYVPFGSVAKPHLTSFKPVLLTAANADTTVATSPNAKKNTQVDEAVEEYKKGQGKN